MRNRIDDEWLNDLLVIYIKSDIFDSVDNEKSLNIFIEDNCNL